MSVRPEAFWSESPPERVTGSECEYGVQGASSGSFVLPTTLARLGYPNHAGYMGSAGGRGRIYADMGHSEYATSEVMGPAAAAVGDLEGVERIADIVTRSGQPHRGVYRTAGTFIPDGRVGDGITRSSEGVTSGYHQNFMFPRAVEFDELTDPLIATSLASRVAWAGAGALREEGFVLSQKVWGTGGAPIAHGIERRTTHGRKPMAIIPSAVHDADTVGDADWARLEVRMTDPGMGLANRFLDFAATSLTLRLIELQRTGKRDGTLGGKRLLELCLAQPVAAAHRFASDLSLQRTVLTRAGKEISALDTQEGLLDAFEMLAQEVALPADELLAIRGLRTLIDGLRGSQPHELSYDRRVSTAADFAPRHLFVSKGKTPDQVTSRDYQLMRRDLLWAQVVSGDGEKACYGRRYWEVMNERHELTPEIRRLAGAAGVSPRASRRADIIDASNGARVWNWARYEDPAGQKQSFGSVYGEGAASTRRAA